MSSSANSSIILPNPYTPMAWLEPEEAYLFEISRYIYVVALGAFGWDWLTSLPVEYRILRTVGLRISTIIYFTSRAFSMGYILTSTVFQIAPVSNCQTLQLVLGICYIFADPSTTALFYLRVIAIYHHQKAVVVFFGACMAAVVGCAALVPTAISGVHIGNTQYCINDRPKEYLVAAPVVSTVFDTLVFIAISYRLSGLSASGETWKDRVKSFFNGSGLPRFSRMLLQGGQLYYGITVVSNIATSALLLNTSLPNSVRVMFTIPNVALENAMATRVFREVYFGPISQKSTSENSTRGRHSAAFHLPRLGHSHGTTSPDNTYAHDHFNVGTIISVKDQIHVTQEIEREVDESISKPRMEGDMSDRESESGFSQV